jgi:hypothetical protein
VTTHHEPSSGPLTRANATARPPPAPRQTG